jgi:hypothetical protein
MTISSLGQGYLRPVQAPRAPMRGAFLPIQRMSSQPGQVMCGPSRQESRQASPVLPRSLAPVVRQYTGQPPYTQGSPPPSRFTRVSSPRFIPTPRIPMRSPERITSPRLLVPQVERQNTRQTPYTPGNPRPPRFTRVASPLPTQRIFMPSPEVISSRPLNSQGSPPSRFQTPRPSRLEATMLKPLRVPQDTEPTTTGATTPPPTEEWDIGLTTAGAKMVAPPLNSAQGEKHTPPSTGVVAPRPPNHPPTGGGSPIQAYISSVLTTREGATTQFTNEQLIDDFLIIVK